MGRPSSAATDVDERGFVQRGWGGYAAAAWDVPAGEPLEADDVREDGKSLRGLI